MPAGDLKRGLRVAFWLANRTVRSADERRVITRALGKRLLDVEFELRSPIPPLKVFTNGAFESLVSVPPLQSLQAGNQGLSGLMHLVWLAKAIAAERIFEIGTYNGLTALTLAANVPDATVETLDLPAGIQPRLPTLLGDTANFSGSTRRTFEGRPEQARIRQHFGDSADFDFTDFGEAVDLVYVDGAHSADYVANDTRAAFRMVSPTGIIVWDDYWRLVPEVANFLHSLQTTSLFRLPTTRLAVWLSPSALERVGSEHFTRTK